MLYGLFVEPEPITMVQRFATRVKFSYIKLIFGVLGVNLQILQTHGALF